MFSITQPSAKPISHKVEWTSNSNIKIVKEWSQSLNKVSTVSSTTYVSRQIEGKDKLHVFGHRSVIVWIPSTTDLSKEFTMVLWFHGHWGYVPSRTFEDRTLKQFVPMTESKNFVVVIPEMPWSVHTKTPTKRNSLIWTKQGSFLKFVSEIESSLSRHNLKENKNVKKATKSLGKIDYRIVGHSAGGSTIKRLGITGDLCKLNPSLVVWSDSSYGMWLDDAWTGCLSKHSNIRVKVFVNSYGSPVRQAFRFIKTLKTKPENLTIHVKKKGWSHKLIGDNIVKLSKLL
jgi:hypothetical protein